MAMQKQRRKSGLASPTQDLGSVVYCNPGAWGEDCCVGFTSREACYDLASRVGSLCGEEHEALTARLSRECCGRDPDYYRQFVGMEAPECLDFQACQDLLGEAGATCGAEQEEAVQQFAQQCSQHAYLKEEMESVQVSACGVPGGGGGGGGGGGNVQGGDINCSGSGCIGGEEGSGGLLDKLMQLAPLLPFLLEKLFGKRTGEDGALDPTLYTEEEGWQAVALYAALGLGGAAVLWSLIGALFGGGSRREERRETTALNKEAS